jgi:hypothetical protein
LLDYVKHYFLSSSPNAITPSKIHQTNLPPIYLQRPRHSLTIVGYESLMDGGSNLLVFDPAFRLSRDIGKTSASATETVPAWEAAAEATQELRDIGIDRVHSLLPMFSAHCSIASSELSGQFLI